MTNTSRPRRPVQAFGFTLVELLVVVGIIAVLMGILLPALGKARQGAQRLTCGTQLHQLASAALLYANDYKGILPPLFLTTGGNAYDSRWYRPAILNNASKGGGWAPYYLREVVATQYESGRLLRCPSDDTPLKGAAPEDRVLSESSSYIANLYTIVCREPKLTDPTVGGHWMYNYSIHNFIKASSVSSCMMFADGWDARRAVTTAPDYAVPDLTGGGTINWGFYTGLADVPNKIETKRHDGRTNVAFADGHVESFTFKDLTQPNGAYVKTSIAFKRLFLPKYATGHSQEDGGTGGF